MSEISEARIIRAETIGFANSAERVGKNLEDMASSLGFGVYADTQFTPGSPLTLTAGSNNLPNNAGSVVETGVPIDNGVPLSFYDGVGIVNQTNDVLALTINLILAAAAGGSFDVKISFDLTAGSGTPPEFASVSGNTFTYLSGNGVERALSYTTIAPGFALWQANGARVLFEPSVACDVHSISYSITRVYKSQL